MLQNVNDYGVYVKNMLACAILSLLLFFIVFLQT